MAYLDLRARSKSNELSFAQFNLKLERGIKQNCDLCRTPYTVFKKQHICKRCYRSVCADCSPFKTKTYLANRNIRLHRNCVVCNAQSTKIQQYIEQNRLRFAKDSDLLFIWSRALTQRKGVKVNRSKSNLRSFVKLENLWSSFNFSYRQFVGRLIQSSNISDADLINMVSNGMEQIEHFFRDKLQDGLYIFIFFLCHADVEVSVNLTLYMLELLQKSKPTKASLKKLIENTGFSEIEMYKLEQFIIENTEILMDSVSINVLPVTATFDIVNNAIISKNINLMWKGILLLFFQRKEIVFKNLNKINAIMLDLLRNPNAVNLKSQLKMQAELSNGQEIELKYGKLLSQYKILLIKNQKLEKELAEIPDKTIKNKVLTDSILSEQSSSSIMNDVTNQHLRFKPEQFNQILESKNQQIIRLKMKNEQFQSIAKQKSSEAQTFSIQNLRLKSQNEQKDKKILKLEEEKNQLRSINIQLIEKMKQLSKMLMTKQEQQIEKSDEAFESIKLKYEELEQQKKEDCNIY